MLDEIKNNVKEKVSKLSSINEREIRYIVSSEILKKSNESYIDIEERKKIEEEIINEITGYGKIEKYLKDKNVTEIMINGTNSLFIEKKGKLYEEHIKLEKSEIELIIQKIVSGVNKTINVANPIVDARLKDGSRVNIVLDGVALNGPVITIRKFSKELLTIESLIENGTLTDELADFFKNIVKNKYNVFISGGTGSGKTTLLNVLSNFIDEGERVITIEDSAELKLRNIKNLVSLETRENNMNETDKITIRDLIVSSLRMRPDRIIVGEVRSVETFDMLQVMNTGHSGSLSTGHANSTRDMLTRLESMVIMNFDMPLIAIKRTIASALDIMIHIARDKNGNRKIYEVSELVGFENGEYVMNTIYKYNEECGCIKKVGALSDKR